jgi:SHS2 domain-containing protein
MPFHYLEDVATADVAFEATGNTIEEMFLAAAEATIGVMLENSKDIRGTDEISFRLEEQELEMLLFDFLQEIIYAKDARRMLLLVDSVDIDKESSPLGLTVRARGETLDSQQHRLLTDVKAVTMHRFAIHKGEHGWTATVVLDV